MDTHVVLVCVFAIAFLLGVSGLGDRSSKKARRPGQRRTSTRQRDYQTLPRPRRKR